MPGVAIHRWATLITQVTFSLCLRSIVPCSQGLKIRGPSPDEAFPCRGDAAATTSSGSIGDVSCPDFRAMVQISYEACTPELRHGTSNITNVDGWNLSALSTNADNTLTLWEKGSQCILAFGGFHFSEHTRLYEAELLMGKGSFASETLCGYGVHVSFAKLLKRHGSTPEWARIAGRLASRACNSGVTVVGSSLGGAMAEIITGCANRERLVEVQGDALPSFHVTRLFTFGGLPVSARSNENTNASRCFPGLRITFEHDPAALAMGGLKHALMDVYEMKKDGTSKKHACGSKQAASAGHRWLGTLGALVSGSGAYEHGMDQYAETILNKSVKAFSRRPALTDALETARIDFRSGLATEKRLPTSKLLLFTWVCGNEPYRYPDMRMFLRSVESSGADVAIVGDSPPRHGTLPHNVQNVVLTWEELCLKMEKLFNATFLSLRDTPFPYRRTHDVRCLFGVMFPHLVSG